MLSSRDDLSPSQVAAYYQTRIPRLKQNGSSEWRGPCPLHGGERDSFAVNPTTGAWFCHSQCSRGGSIFDFEMEASGINFAKAKDQVMEIVGGSPPVKPKFTATYDYTDEQGNLLFQVVRFEPKDFRQRQQCPDCRGKRCPKCNDTGWKWAVKGVRLVPYRLPKILEAKHIVIVEGEKDVHTAENLGLVASCNAMGAGTWRPDFARYFKDRHVAILPDDDEAGREHAEKIALSLVGHAASIRMVPIPAGKGKDLTDWVMNGGTLDEIRAAINGTQSWKASAEAKIESTPDVAYRSIEMDLKAAISKGDLYACWGKHREVAQLPTHQRLQVKALLKQGFPKDFSGRDWDQAISAVLRDRHGTEEHISARVSGPSPALIEPIPDAPDLTHYYRTDSGNAERLMAIHGEDVRYCPEMRKWLTWDGQRWRVDDQDHIRHFAVQTMRTLYAQIPDAYPDLREREEAVKFALGSESAGAVSNMLAQAKFPEVCVRADELDSDPWLLNCLNGTLDLHTGTLRPPRRGEQCRPRGPG